MSTYIKYEGRMTEDIKYFCGKNNVISEPHPNTGCIGYFLNEINKSDYYMFRPNMYIILDESKNISLSFNQPQGEEYILKPLDATHVERTAELGNLYYKLKDDYLAIWTGYEWDECSSWSSQGLKLEEL